MYNMKVILKNAVIVDPNSEWNSKKADILISDGVIEKIAKSISDQSAQVVKATNLHVSPGWFDMHVNFRDPGEEYKEKLEGHLKADDFFGTEKNPNATLVFKKIAAKANGIYTITGDLTIKGITNAVTFDLAVKGNTASTVVKIDRTKYDIKYGSKSFFESIGDKAINDDFDLTVNLQF